MSIATKHLRIATRGSQLALWQANYVASLLKARGVSTEIQIVKTTGDRVQDRFLHEMGGKGLFVRELEETLQSGAADLAVHSLKDLPARVPEPFTLAAILKRHIPNDTMILHPRTYERLKVKLTDPLNRQRFAELGPLTIATASLRRQSLLKGLPHPIQLVAVRGNVDTRIRKLEESDWDGLILAGASLERLGLHQLPQVLLDTDWFVPCAAQGALAIETSVQSPHRELLAELSDPQTFAAATIERRVLELLGGDCTMPFGAFFHYDPHRQTTHGRAVVLDYDGRDSRCHLEFPGTPEHLPREDTARAIVRALEGQGLAAITRSLEIKTPDLGTLR